MAWRDAFGRWVARWSVVREAVYANADLTVEDRGWRPAGSAMLRDVGLAQHLDNIKNAEDAYRINPLAFRLIELTTDYVLGKGMVVRAETERARSFVLDWWEHPQNRMAIRQFDMMTELSLSGELFVTLHTNSVDRLTYVRLVPSSSIDQIEVNPEDLEDERRFHRVAVVSAWDGVKWDGTADEGGRWWDAQDCRHYTVNKLVGGIRGQGDLVPLLPWLRRYKDWLTDRVRINKFKGAFLWDVTLKGADRRAIEQRKQEIGEAPASGSLMIHNETEEWRPVQPQIGADAVAEDGRAIRLMIASGSGVPLHFLSEPEGASKATAAEMLAPTVRHYGRRQLAFGWLMVDLARECGRRYGLGADDLAGLHPIFEDLTSRDNLEIAQAAEMIAKALEVAHSSGWVSDGDAGELFRKFCSEPLGVALRRGGDERAGGRKERPSGPRAGRGDLRAVPKVGGTGRAP